MGVCGAIFSLEDFLFSNDISGNQELLNGYPSCGMLAAYHRLRESLLPSAHVEFSQKDIQRRGLKVPRIAFFLSVQ